MSNSSPFLQELTNTLKSNGASDTDVKEVEIAVNQDVQLAQDLCNETEGYVWDTETNTCELEINIEKQVDVDPAPVEEKPVVNVSSSDGIDVTRTPRSNNDVFIELTNTPTGFDEVKKQYSNLFVDNDYFGDPDGRSVFFGQKSERSNESYVREELKDKLKAMGIFISETHGIRDVVNFQVGQDPLDPNSWQYNESVPLGSDDIKWGEDGQGYQLLNKDRVDRINKIISIALKLKIQEDPNFDIDYFNYGYDNLSKINKEELGDRAERLLSRRNNTISDTIENYLKSSGGDQMRLNLVDETNAALNNLFMDIYSKYQESGNLDPALMMEEYMREADKTIVGVYQNNDDYNNLIYNLSLSTSGFFDDAIQEAMVKENIAMELGEYYARDDWHSKLALGIVKGFGYKLPAELKQVGFAYRQQNVKNVENSYSSAIPGDRIKFDSYGDENFKSFLSLIPDLTGLNPRNYKNPILGGNPETVNNWSGNPTSIGKYVVTEQHVQWMKDEGFILMHTGTVDGYTLGMYKNDKGDIEIIPINGRNLQKVVKNATHSFVYNPLGSLNPVVYKRGQEGFSDIFIKEVLAHAQGKQFDKLLNVIKDRDVRNGMTSDSEELFSSKKGGFTITTGNWAQAVGDGVFRAATSLLSLGFGSILTESSNAYQQGLFAIAQDKFEGFDKMSDNEKASKLLLVLDQFQERLWNQAKAVGAINGVLETVGNLAMIGKIGKGIGDNVTDYMKLWFNLNVRQALKSTLKAGLAITTANVVESLTEVSQELITNYAMPGEDSGFNELVINSWDPYINAATTAFITSTSLVGGGKSFNYARNAIAEQISAIRNPDGIIAYVKARKDQLNKDLKAGFTIDNMGNKVPFGEKEFEEIMGLLGHADRIFTKFQKTWRDPAAVKTLFESEIRLQAEIKQKIKLEKERDEILDNAKKLNPGLKQDELLEMTDVASTLADLQFINDKIKREKEEQVKAAYLDNYEETVRLKSNEINSKYGENWEAMVYTNNNDASIYLQNEFGITSASKGELGRLYRNFMNGKANAFVLSREEILDFMPNYKGTGIALFSDQNIKNNIKAGDLTSTNVVAHELEHILYTEKFKGEQGDVKVDNFRKDLQGSLEESQDPNMQMILGMINRRMQSSYGNLKPGERNYNEEYLIAFGDFCKGLEIWGKIQGENASNMLGPNFVAEFTKIGNAFWKHLHDSKGENNFNFLNILNFASGLKGVNVEEDDVSVVLDKDGKKSLHIREQLSDDYSMMREVSNLTYPDRSDMNKDQKNRDRLRVNKNLAEKIIEAENDPNPLVRKGAIKYRQELVINNWSALEGVIKKHYKFDNPLHSDVNFDQFRGLVLQEFIRQTNITYDPTINDSFYNYFFAPKMDWKYAPSSIADIKIPGIWEKLQKQFTVSIDPTPDSPGMTPTELQVFQDSEIDVIQQIENFSEMSALRNSFSKDFGFDINDETGKVGKNYSAWMDLVKEKYKGLDFSTLFDENASQDLRNLGKDLWKDFRKLGQEGGKFNKGGKPTEQYINFIENSVDAFFSQMSVKDLVKFLGDDKDLFLDLKEERADTDKSQAIKGRDKPKNKYAGNAIRYKKDLDADLRQKLIDIMLNKDGNFRFDSLIQRTLKNYSSILFNDASMQVVSSKEFKDENGVTDGQISQLSLLLNKGKDVRFQYAGEESIVKLEELNPKYFDKNGSFDPSLYQKDMFKFFKDIRKYAEKNNIDESDDYEIIISHITNYGQRKGFDLGSIQLIQSFFDKGFVEDAGISQFQSNMTNDKYIPDNIKTERIPISSNVDGKNAMHDNAIIMTNIFGKQFMDAVGYEFLGYKNHGKYLRVGKEGSEFAERFLNMVNGVKDVELSPEMETALKNFRRYNLKAGENANLTKTENENNIFKKLKDILQKETNEDGSVRTREQKLQEIRSSGLAAEIENANKANTFILTNIITKFKDAAIEGKIDEKAMLEMFKMGSNLTLGLRSLSTLIGYHVVDGKQDYSYIDKNGKPKNRWEGEHLGSYSNVFSKVVSLIYKYKKDKNVDFDRELSIILSDFGQLLGDGKHFKDLNTYGSTNPVDTYRANLIKNKDYTNANGVDLKGIAADILIRKEAEMLAMSKNPKVKYSVPSADPESSRNFVAVDESGNLDLNQSFNNIIENESGIEAYKTYSEAEGKIRGQGNKSLWDIAFPASAYDLEQFTYKYLGKGKLGDKQKQFFEEQLFRPFAEATTNINREKQRISEAQKELIKKLPKINKSLKNKIKNKKGETTFWTREHALRVWLWDKNGIANAKDLGLAQETYDMLIAEVNGDQNLQQFAVKLGEVSAQTNGYVKPSQYWTVEGVTQDLQRITSDAGRAKYLEKWKANVDILFSEENKNKLRAAYGNKHVEALEDMLYRMEFGKNKKQASRIETAWNNWVNNSVGAVMFLNTRSGVLQTISAANYIDYGDNNFIEAGKRVLNIKQYSKDIAKIFMSDYLKQRRGGHTRGINEAELAAVIEKGGVKGAMSWFLEKGFTFAKWGDSWAISSGGATFYRSKIIAYLKQGMTLEKAENKAWTDFQERTEANQQSSRADKISQQQAGGLGRILLAFGNTPMQYNRIIMKSVQDLKNNRGKTIENIGRIAYYGAVQNAIFVTLQQAVFAAFGEDEDEWDKKTKRAASGMVDSLLKGMGLSGVVISTAKNSYMQWQDQRKKGYNADHAYTILQFANMSPTIGSKLRKLYAGTQAEKFNQDTIDEMGFDINSPALNAIANLISATTNVPTDRALQKTQNILLASKDHVEVQDKIALLLGWNPWDLNVETEAKIVRKEVKKKKEIKKKEEKVETEQKKVDIVVEEEVKKEEEGKGEDVNTCAASKSDGSGRCGVKVDKAGDKCQYHASEKEKSKMKKCGHIKKNGKQCGNYAVNDAGRCNVKQHQPGYKKK